MPLIQGHGRKAFDHNVEAEMHADKPQDQALAIAYAIKRKNAQKRAMGGMIGDQNPTEDRGPTDLMNPIDMGGDDDFTHAEINEDKGYDEKDTVTPGQDLRKAEARGRVAENMAHGGMMNPSHMVQMIMKKKAHGMEKGGLVDDFLSDEEASEGPGGEGQMMEDREDMGMTHKGRLHKIMAGLHARHLGM